MHKECSLYTKYVASITDFLLYISYIFPLRFWKCAVNIKQKQGGRIAGAHSNHHSAGTLCRKNRKANFRFAFSH